MRYSIAVCIGTFVALVWMLRRSGVSLGLPIAYLANLLLLHVPGAVGKIFDKTNAFTPASYTRTGIIFTAIGTVMFTIGVWIIQIRGADPVPRPAARSVYWRYCVLAGGVCTVIGYLINIPSIGAVFSRGGSIWMLGVMLGLTSALAIGDRTRAARWTAILFLYPVLMLLLGGFLSYGSMAVIIVLSAVVVSARSYWRVAIVSTLSLVVGMSIFLSYFQHRPEIRAAVWSGADTDARIDATMKAVRDIRLFNPSDPAHLFALDQRLNQNYFVGLAAERLKTNQVDYLHGLSLWEGVQAMVPRALWPDKPVVAGSPKIVSEMTGLVLSTSTSFGVGNVMEFHINFGIAGLVFGFLLLGLAIGYLDRRAAEANLTGDLGRVFIYFLPAVALIQPNGSVVEMMSGAAASLAAAYAWQWGWRRWPKPLPPARMGIAGGPQPLAS